MIHNLENADEARLRNILKHYPSNIQIQLNWLKEKHENELLELEEKAKMLRDVNAANKCIEGGGRLAIFPEWAWWALSAVGVGAFAGGVYIGWRVSQ